MIIPPRLIPQNVLPMNRHKMRHWLYQLKPRNSQDILEQASRPRNLV